MTEGNLFGTSGGIAPHAQCIRPFTFCATVPVQGDLLLANHSAERHCNTFTSAFQLYEDPPGNPSISFPARSQARMENPIDSLDCINEQHLTPLCALAHTRALRATLCTPAAPRTPCTAFPLTPGSSTAHHDHPFLEPRCPSYQAGSPALNCHACSPSRASVPPALNCPVFWGSCPVMSVILSLGNKHTRQITGVASNKRWRWTAMDAAVCASSLPCPQPPLLASMSPPFPPRPAPQTRTAHPVRLQPQKPCR